MSRAVPRHVLAWSAAAAVLLVYLATAAPGAWWGDGQELACAAWTLGIPHPTGYPLYTLLGHGFMKLAGGLDPGRALTILSALLLACSCGLLILLFQRILTGELLGGTAARACGVADLLPAVGVALLVAFSFTLWEHATFAEVYPLTFLFVVVVVHLAWPSRGSRPGLGRAAAIGLAFGLAMLNHYSILAVAPLAGLCVLRWGIDRRRLPAFIGVALAGLLVTVLGYFYLLLRARSNPPLNWGDPSTFSRLMWVLSGGQFRELKVAGSGEAALRGLANWVAWWGAQFLPANLARPLPSLVAGLVVLAISLLGLARLTRARWELGLGLLAAILMTAIFSMAYQIPDIAPYFLPALPAAAIGWILTAWWLAERTEQKHPEFQLGPLMRTVPALCALAMVLWHFRAIDKSADDAPGAWGRAVIETLPADAIVLTGADSDCYCLWYQQMVLGQRPDVSIVGSNFIFQGWYARYFESAGRPRIPIRIEDRPPTDKLPFDVAIFDGFLIPNFKQGRRIFITFTHDELIRDLLNPKPAASLLPLSYYQSPLYPVERLPSPRLYELTPNAGLAEMSREELTETFRNWYLNRGRR